MLPRAIPAPNKLENLLRGRYLRSERSDPNLHTAAFRRSSVTGADRRAGQTQNAETDRDLLFHRLIKFEQA